MRNKVDPQKKNVGLKLMTSRQWLLSSFISKDPKPVLSYFERPKRLSSDVDFLKR